ncbi:glycoside hydrolase family 73 protein, partial [Oenococcus oeni]|uniref:glycoside hydrolase family 73 protein n=1 Tax=Oenococcus oeni TaxID=1247 RepID=UPI0039C916DF
NHENTLIAEQKFIDKVAPYIQKRQKKDGILASITIAQMILESDWGKSSLASKYHNYFGVKSTSDDAKKTVKIDTQEYVNGQWVTVKGTFAVYKNWFKTSLYQPALYFNGKNRRKWSLQLPPVVIRLTV